MLTPLLEDPLAADDAIAALRPYSLVTQAADGAVSVHRLVQAVTADQMPADLARRLGPMILLLVSQVWLWGVVFVAVAGGVRRRGRTAG